MGKELEKQVNEFNKNWFNSKRKNIGMNSFYNFIVEEDNLNRSFKDQNYLPRVSAPKGNFDQTAEFYKDKNGMLIHNPFYNKDLLTKAKSKLQSWIDNDLTNTTINVSPEILNEGLNGYYSGLDENTIHVADPKDLWTALHESMHRLTDYSRDDQWTGKSRHFADIKDGEDPYWDSIKERYARLHADRITWGLNPNKIYTKEELLQLWNDKGIQPPGAFLWGDEKKQNEIVNAINNSYRSGGKLPTYLKYYNYNPQQ